jgi:hypothetical protein
MPSLYLSGLICSNVHADVGCKEVYSAEPKEPLQSTKTRTSSGTRRYTTLGRSCSRKCSQQFPVDTSKMGARHCRKNDPIPLELLRRMKKMTSKR